MRKPEASDRYGGPPVGSDVTERLTAECSCGAVFDARLYFVKPGSRVEMRVQHPLRGKKHRPQFFEVPAHPDDERMRAEVRDDDLYR